MQNRKIKEEERERKDKEGDDGRRKEEGQRV